MIQTAHVGVGIYGREGEQAASFSDYALPEFKFLRRLLFIHGRDMGCKIVNFLAWYNYQAILFSVVSIYSNCYNGFSGVSLFQDMYEALYNINISSTTMIGYIFYDHDLDMKNPKIPFKGMSVAQYYGYCRDNYL
jgi:magnesium-transporting ATPase (P-type)